MDDNADMIVVVGGKNDYNLQQPIADFKTNLAVLCQGLINKYIGKKICFFTPWCTQDWSTESWTIKLIEYVDAIKEVCGNYSIPVFDSSRNGGIYAFDAAFRIAYFQGDSDVSHLNNAGHDLFLPKGESFLLSL
jgi:hypothetical protein